MAGNGGEWRGMVGNGGECCGKGGKLRGMGGDSWGRPWMAGGPEGLNVRAFCKRNIVMNLTI